VLQGVNALMEDNFKHHITYVLGPFIRVHGDRVDLFHQSAKDFILGRSARGIAASSDSLPSCELPGLACRIDLLARTSEWSNGKVLR
jgi:hypothetical protein